MSGVSGGSNYISNGALLAWATQQQNRLYGDLHETMQQQELQGEMASDLADIKKHLEDLVQHPENAKDVETELIEFGRNYGSNPQFAEVTSSVAEIEQVVREHVPVTDTVANAVDPEEVSAGAVPAPVTSSVKGSTGGTSPNGHGGFSSPPAATAPPELTQETIKNWTQTLDEKLSASGINQQLGMVHVNEVKSTIDQSTQMTSLMIKSSNDATDQVIHNFA